MALADRPPLPAATAERLRVMDELLRRAGEVRERLDQQIGQLRALLGQQELGGERR